MWAWLFLYAGGGLIIGSFLNVFVIRSRTGRSISGRSGCLSCGERLRSTELIPIISWMLQRGTCGTCGSSISLQYPLVEIVTGALFVAVLFANVSIAASVFLFALFSIWVAIATYDIRHRIVPDEWGYGAALFAIFYFVSIHEGAIHSFWFWIAGPLVALPIAFLWYFSDGRAIGLGDAKLALSVGWFLGPASGLVALLCSFVVGALYALAVLLPLPHYRTIAAVFFKNGVPGRGKKFNMKSEVPFGPFMLLGALVVWAVETFNFSIPLLSDMLLLW